LYSYPSPHRGSTGETVRLSTLQEEIVTPIKVVHHNIRT
jgi:hypothetical protein